MKGLQHRSLRMPSLRGRAPVTVALLLLTGLLAVFGPTPSAQAVINPGSIAGTVTDAEGDPLPGITVSVLRYSQVVGQDQTDATGGFQLDNLAADPYGYIVRFTDPSAEYATEWYDDQIAANMTPVPVTPFATTFGVDATLEPAASITGRVTTGTGAPVTGGKVGLWVWLRWVGVDSHHLRDRPDRPLHHRGGQGGHLPRGVLRPGDWYPGVLGRQSQHGRCQALVVASGDSLTADAVLGGQVRNIAAPTIGGTAQVGQPLTASAGSWTPVGHSRDLPVGGGSGHRAGR